MIPIKASNGIVTTARFLAAPKCEKCRRIQCNGCVGGIFTGKCPFCDKNITKSDKIN